MLQPEAGSGRGIDGRGDGWIGTGLEPGRPKRRWTRGEVWVPGGNGEEGVHEICKESSHKSPTLGFRVLVVFLLLHLVLVPWEHFSCVNQGAINLYVHFSVCMLTDEFVNE